MVIFPKVLISQFQYLVFPNFQSTQHLQRTLYIFQPGGQKISFTSFPADRIFILVIIGKDAHACKKIHTIPMKNV